jgi:hypothetical protein
MEKKVTINILIKNNILDNLYKDNELIIKGSDGEKQYNHMIGSSKDFFYKQKDFNAWKKEKNEMFLDSLYGFSLKQFNKKDQNLLTNWIKENLNDKLYNSIFSTNLHLPAFGIYNKQTKHFLFVGIGRKNIIFSFCSDSKIELKNVNQFCQFDYGLVIQQLVNSLTIAAEFHEVLCTSGIDPESKKAFNLNFKSFSEITKIQLAIPRLSDDMSLLSPCSF